MKYTADKNEKYIIVTLENEQLNASISPELKSELVIFNAEGYRNIILDLSKVKHIDSSGLSCLLTGNRICQNSEGSFLLTEIQPAVRKLIDITRLDKSLRIIPKVQEAVDFVFMEELEREFNQPGED